MAPFETKIKTDIPRFQHVDFLVFWVDPILDEFWPNGRSLTPQETRWYFLLVRPRPVPYNPDGIFISAVSAYPGPVGIFYRWYFLI